MAAAPRYATFSFQGLQSGRIYNVDAYLSDVVDALVRFDGGAGAGATSPEQYIAPEPIVLFDFAVASGLTDTTKIMVLRNNQPTGDHLRYAQHLNTNAFRSPLRIGFRPGQAVRAIQKA